MNDRDWNYEELTDVEARLRHSDCQMIQVFSIAGQTGERRPAIFVWRSEAVDDEEDPEAVYWLNRAGRPHSPGPAITSYTDETAGPKLLSNLTARLYSLHRFQLASLPT